MRLGTILTVTVCALGALPLHAADTTDSRGVQIEGEPSLTNPGVNSTTGPGERPGPAQETGMEPASGAIDENNFRTLDADRDGYVSKQEAAGHRDLMDSFSELDDDADGQLTAEEFSNYRRIDAR